jgi:hypothetical protein
MTLFRFDPANWDSQINSQEKYFFFHGIILLHRKRSSSSDSSYFLCLDYSFESEEACRQEEEVKLKVLI